MKRYEAVGVLRKRAPVMTGTDECLSYLDMFAPEGERLRTPIEPIAEEI